jgi:hypothetical protein
MDILQTLQMSIIMAFRSLPLLLIGFIGFLAIGLGNMGLFVLFIGHAFALPLVTGLVQLLTRGISAFQVKATDVSQLVPSAPRTSDMANVGPSYWMAQFLFFMGYLLANAVSLYMTPDDPKIDDVQLANQKAKATTAIITTVLLTLVVVWLRYLTHTETMAGIGLAFLIGWGGGYGWYQLAAVCGARSADVFGITQQLVPVAAKDTKPMTCVYNPTP